MTQARSIHAAAALLKLNPHGTEVNAIFEFADELSDLLYYIATEDQAWKIRDRAEAVSIKLTGLKDV
ncbi:hypothetical protein [Leifsonia sp. Root227]|uniref:hypothetical protein n=1 Tax=Leifsonia sp. Root227 TaxID=1736496 RepID=UPI000AB566BE|nr:hypothetical protein [Leifsonia sp. Root227]